jgi:hypothetical protein
MDTEILFEKWKAAYDALVVTALVVTDDDSIEELDFFGVAVGFCLANGMSYEDAIDFYYGVCVKRGSF